MFNVLLDKLPVEWNGYEIDGDFQIGVQISQCMTDEALNPTERIVTAAGLLFGDNGPKTYEEITEALNWFLNGWNHDNIKASGKGASSKKKSVETMDFDVDQWRIYAAFKSQYGIDLNTEQMHFWTFMGLVSSLEECAFTRVVSIRERKIDSKMPKEEKTWLRKAKEMFRIRKEEDVKETEAEKEERQAAIDEFNRIRKRK